MTRFPSRKLLVVLCLLGSSACARQDSMPPTDSSSETAPKWIRTTDGPSEVRLLGWGEAVLSNGLVLGVGRAKDQVSSLGFLYHPDSNRWTSTPLVPGVDALGENLVALPDGQALGNLCITQGGPSLPELR